MPVERSASKNCYFLWVDGVGAFQLFTSESVTLGGPTRDKDPADLVLLANLSRRHATFLRSEEGYVLEAHGACKVADRPVEGRTHLNSNYRLELGSGVRVQFRIPSVLSATAVIDFISDHRPNRSIDGVILMDETCLLGPSTDNHVVCPDWTQTVLLYRKADGFWAKSQSQILIDGKLMPEGGGPVKPGSYVSGNEFGFRLEACA
ncbi:MAG TPA: FHA domain-containing protein [Planctomycetaceae bacterium]|nr:FHA domain-containing protein [Planctomycetaceae bacterium]